MRGLSDDLAAVGLGEGVQLQVEGLLPRRDLGLPDVHAPSSQNLVADPRSKILITRRLSRRWVLRKPTRRRTTGDEF